MPSASSRPINAVTANLAIGNLPSSACACLIEEAFGFVAIVITNGVWAGENDGEDCSEQDPAAHRNGDYLRVTRLTTHRLTETRTGTASVKILRSHQSDELGGAGDQLAPRAVEAERRQRPGREFVQDRLPPGLALGVWG